MTKIRPKNRSLNCDLFNFLYWYGIFWVPPGKSSCPGGQEYVWQRGVEGRACFFGHLIFLLPDRILSHSPKFGRPKQGPNFYFKILLNFFSECWLHRDFLGVIPKEFLGTELFTKKFRFSRISLSVPQKKYRARAPTILMPQTFPIASLNRYTPNFSGGPKRRPGVISLPSSTLQSQPIRKVVHDLGALRCFFFDKISFPGQTVHFAYSMSYIFWKLLFQQLILAINKSFWSILRGVRFLLTHWDAYVNSILHCVIIHHNRDDVNAMRQCREAKNPVEKNTILHYRQNSIDWSNKIPTQGRKFRDWMPGRYIQGQIHNSQQRWCQWGQAPTANQHIALLELEEEASTTSSHLESWQTVSKVRRRIGTIFNFIKIFPFEIDLLLL